MTSKLPPPVVINDAEYRTHEIDLAAALDKSAPAWANGKKHVDIARAEIEKQLRILESEIGLTAGVKAAAWIAVQDAILGRIFGFNDLAGVPVQGAIATLPPTGAQKATARGFLPGQLGLTYSDSRNRDFVEAVEDVLEALESHANMQVALDVKGIFYRPATDDTDGDGTADDPTVVLNHKNGNGEDGVKLFDRLDSRVQYLIGSSDFTRFGAWRRQTSPNAKEDYVNRTEYGNGDGPSALAYSTLAKTTYITPTGGGLDPRFPAGARMTYEGETIGVIGTVFISGDINVEVLWDTSTLGGLVNMSISEIENVADGARLYLDTNTTTNTIDPNDAAAAGVALQEVVSIDINNVDVSTALGLSLDSDSTDTSTIVVNSIASGTVGATATTLHDNLTNTSNEANVTGQFVGQGLSGPLAVLGTWEMRNGTSGSNAIGAQITEDYGAAGSKVSVTGTTFGDAFADPDTFPANGVRIHGGFGAEAP